MTGIGGQKPEVSKNIVLSAMAFSILGALLFALCSSAEAQQPKKIPRVGFLSPGASPGNDFRYEAFQQGLRELGYVEGKSITVEYRGADGKTERFKQLAVELVHHNIDVIVTATQAGVLAAKTASRTIPIVMAAGADPVASGLIASLARPGGNITGLTNISGQLSGKRLELLNEVIPTATRIAVLQYRGSPLGSLKETEAAARALSIDLRLFEVGDPSEFDRAFSEISAKRLDALIVLPGPLLVNYRKPIVDFAAKERLPAIYANTEFTNSGGLMSYEASLPDLFRRAAAYVDKILKGAKPADLPVEQPTKFELLINLKTAKQIGVTIPQTVLYRADKVIK
jgi:putative tryptophan/tyrosine transport system substrate-binding protein